MLVGIKYIRFDSKKVKERSYWTHFSCMCFEERERDKGGLGLPNWQPRSPFNKGSFLLKAP